MKKKAFTLIELIAVLVIMAIIALIVTPLVMSIIRKAKISARKRSIDAYGRSVELAIATYLLDNGTFPTSIEQLTIEYSESVVECETTQLNPDSTVYLAGCTVGGRLVDEYSYGTDNSSTYEAYEIGDEVTYNNVVYRVIKDSSASESTVTLLKAEPLSYSEVQTYSAGTGATTSDSNGYGGIPYGTTSTYATSYAKATVDAWKAAQAPLASDARLLTVDDIPDLGYEWFDNGSAALWKKTESTPIWVYNWVYNSNYWYWTMSQYNDSSSIVWCVSSSDMSGSNVDSSLYNVLRPVIVLSKSVISS